MNSPSAPPGPIFMPQYANSHGLESARLADEARSYFEKGVEMRETGDEYVKITVFLATVHLLTALSQRFTMVGPRVAAVAIAFAMLLISMYWILDVPASLESAAPTE